MSKFSSKQRVVGQPSLEAEAARTEPRKLRLRSPERDQVVLWGTLEQLLDRDHKARAVWDAVCQLDLSRWLSEIKSVEGGPGRNATDPRVLVALWVYATLDGVGSAREIAGLCEHDSLPYRWLAGGVTLCHRLLSDFRAEGSEKLDDLLTQIVASLLAGGLVTMQRVAQDGMRVRAHAGKSSFRRRPTLERCLDEARQQVETLKRLADEPGELSRRQQAARERAARERQQRIEEAIRQCDALQQQREETAAKSGRKVKEARASTTDPEARVMKFADGGTRPGYNVQYATDTASGIIVGVEVTNAGNDQEQLPPMLDQLQARYGQRPKEAVVDGGLASREAIEASAEHGCTVYAPLKDEEKQVARGVNPYLPKKGDSDVIAKWRARMGTAAGKAIYRLRCQTAEWVNALCRNRGFWQMPVRGRPKCRAVAVLYAIAHDLVLAMKLRADLLITAG